MSEHSSLDRAVVSPDSSRLAFVAIAMVAWAVFEFATRGGLVSLLADPLGTGRGADALILTFGFPLIAALVAWWGIRAGIDPADWEYEVSLRTVGAGLAGVVVYFAVYGVLTVVLATVLNVQPTLDAGATGTAGAPAWALALFLVGNGIVVPITEELAWRGVIQTALTESYGAYVAVVVTALAFVGKHLVVDLAAPPFRVASLLVGAFVYCGLRARYGTAASTVTHLGANLVATAGLVLA